MMDRIKALLTVIEEGSVNRAAVRLRITQPALSRQMQALEHELGGRLLERETSGVKPTGLGHALVKSMRPLVENYDAALADLRRQARGEHSELRVGYLFSAAQSMLTPALARLRKSHPQVKLKLHDMSPREQIDGLRSGELDLALIGQEGMLAAREFHSARLRSFTVCGAVADGDSLAQKKRITLKELKGRDFIGVDEDQVPGRNRWMTALCKSAGFKPRFAIVVDGITHVLSQVVSESAVTLLPGYFEKLQHPGVTFVPVSDDTARWDCMVLWQKGRASAAARALVDALKQVAAEIK
ncbi:LysR family transcriptional regulator [Prosthecobacter vanneervenii]|uniref:DNA-binding transcriptional LysR family regulator n=1 Tax=Prosthecobacter vanneervenii TaxID=48466 RepID=A0A7W8DK69_9BACT|nr:LysR family transcriptional regulator [Prosthecobacter vanneervenii]MBB5032556.1 DNA-binding transcriptional LysR family regulator [Prosthecobacter vanneervenii]